MIRVNLYRVTDCDFRLVLILDNYRKFESVPFSADPHTAEATLARVRAAALGSDSIEAGMDEMRSILTNGINWVL